MTKVAAPTKTQEKKLEIKNTNFTKAVANHTKYSSKDQPNPFD